MGVIIQGRKYFEDVIRNTCLKINAGLTNLHYQKKSFVTKVQMDFQRPLYPKLFNWVWGIDKQSYALSLAYNHHHLTPLFYTGVTTYS